MKLIGRLSCAESAPAVYRATSAPFLLSLSSPLSRSLALVKSLSGGDACNNQGTSGTREGLRRR